MRPNAAVLILFFASCSASANSQRDWPKAEGQPLVDASATHDDSEDAARPKDLSGRYVGAYVCPQGQTSMVLSVEHHADGKVEAVFEFGPHESNPDVPTGSFRMRGIVDDNGKIRLEATEEDWIEQPEGYITIDLNGRFDGSVLAGEVVNPECSTFHAERARTSE